MRISVVILLSLVMATPQSPANGIERVLGAWEGTAEHNGETARVIIEFVRTRDRVLALASVPANHAWQFPVAVVTMSGNTVSGGPLTLELDPAAATLTTTLPAEMVPKYPLRVVLRRRAAVVPEPRPPVEGPARQPSWTFALGSPSWADVATIGGLVVVGAEDGRLHAVDGHGRERWTFQADGSIRAAAGRSEPIWSCRLMAACSTASTPAPAACAGAGRSANP